MGFKILYRFDLSVCRNQTANSAALGFGGPYRHTVIARHKRREQDDRYDNSHSPKNPGTPGKKSAIVYCRSHCNLYGIIYHLPVLQPGKTITSLDAAPGLKIANPCSL